MLRVTVFLRPARLRFCSTIIVRDIVCLKAKRAPVVCPMWVGALMRYS